MSSIFSTVPLLKAASSGKYQEVNRLIQNGADVNVLGDYGRTVLSYVFNERWNEVHDEADRDYLQTAEVLVAAGANINANGERGRTPLMLAMKNNNLAGVYFLLRHGVNLNAVDDDNQSVLHETYVYYDDDKTPQIFEILLKAGANPNISDVNGATPIMTLSKFPTLTKLLIQYGANVSVPENIDDKVDYDLFKAAIEEDNIETVKLLIERCRLTNNPAALIQQKDEQGQSLLFKTKSEQMFNLLVEAGVDINEITPTKETLLTYALSHRFLNAAYLLLDKGMSLAVINIKTEGRCVWTHDNNTTALCEAVRNANPGAYPEDIEQYKNIAIRLMELGANPLIPFQGETIFQFSHHPDIRAYFKYRAERGSPKPSFLVELRERQLQPHFQEIKLENKLTR